MLRQRTLEHCIRATGIGLHTGAPVQMTLCPAAVDRGIVFRRVDCMPPAEIVAKASRVIDTALATTLAQDSARVQTVEHLLAALAGLGIDNAVVEIDGDELPIMDGSAGAFVFLLQSAGIRELDAPKRFLRIKRCVQVADGDKWARLAPCAGFELHAGIDFDHPAFDARSRCAALDFSTAAFVKQIGRARTFGFVRDIESLRARDRARGASLNNAVVLDDQRVLNADGLRYTNECARHKILDAIGDLYLLGHALVGRYAGYKAGHALNNRLVSAVLADASAWQLTRYPDRAGAPVDYGNARPVMAA